MKQSFGRAGVLEKGAGTDFCERHSIKTTDFVGRENPSQSLAACVFRTNVVWIRAGDSFIASGN